MTINNFNRRDALLGLTGAAAVVALPFSGAAYAAGVPTQLKMGFDIIKDGKTKIGEHVVAFKLGAGNRLQIDTQAQIAAKVAGITAFSMDLQVRELWQEDQLLAMMSRVRRNGENKKVDVRAANGKLVITGAAGKIQAPASAVPTSFWSIAGVKRRQLIDIADGRLLNVSAKAMGRNKLTVSSQPVAATRFDTTGDLALSLWYTDKSEWVGLSTTIRGAKVSYRRTI